MKKIFQSLLIGTVICCHASEEDFFSFEKEALMETTPFRTKESPATFFAPNALAKILEEREELPPSLDKTPLPPSPLSLKMPSMTESEFSQLRIPVYCDIPSCEFSLGTARPRHSIPSLSNHYRSAHGVSFKKQRMHSLCLACLSLFSQPELKDHITLNHTLQEFEAIKGIFTPKPKGDAAHIDSYLKEQDIVFHCQELSKKSHATGENKRCKSSFTSPVAVRRHYLETHRLLKKIPTDFQYHCTECDTTHKGTISIYKHLHLFPHKEGTSPIETSFSTYNAAS